MEMEKYNINETFDLVFFSKLKIQPITSNRSKIRKYLVTTYFLNPINNEF